MINGLDTCSIVTDVHAIQTIRIDQTVRVILHISIPIQRLRSFGRYRSPPRRIRRQPPSRRWIVFTEEVVVDAGDGVLVLAGEGAVGGAGLVVGFAEGRIGLFRVDAMRPRRRQPRGAEPVLVPNEVQST